MSPGGSSSVGGSEVLWLVFERVAGDFMRNIWVYYKFFTASTEWPGSSDLVFDPNL